MSGKRPRLVKLSLKVDAELAEALSRLPSTGGLVPADPLPQRAREGPVPGRVGPLERPASDVEGRRQVTDGGVGLGEGRQHLRILFAGGGAGLPGAQQRLRRTAQLRV